MTQRFIPYSRQHIDDEDIAAVTAVLRSDWLTQGPAIETFERKVAEYCGAAHAVAVSSATAGLHLACLALGVGEGDLVWTSPLSFVASANCARYVGAEVDFVDVEPETGNLSIAALQMKLETAAQIGRLPKVIIPVHYSGRTCDMAAMVALKKRYGFKIIEDAAHALGAKYTDGSPVGSNRDSDAIVFSFHPVKPVTTGEGGVVVTASAALAEQVRLLRSHGITRDAAALKQKNMPAWYYEQQSLGYHYRMTDMQAALGISQMAKLDRLTNIRRKLAERYDGLLRDFPLLLPPLDVRSSWHLYAVQLTKHARDTIFNMMRKQHIGVNVHYIPIHLQPYYQALGFQHEQFPSAEQFFAHCLSLPLHPGLSEDDQDYVAAALRKAMG